ncbi:unnamed protein product [Linum trigynum]|uniref:Uncharacterized protein n=1 Tax=Linum trigynum TaxID=586398 RepID=A0AAV2FRL0_9ROSI
MEDSSAADASSIGSGSGREYRAEEGEGLDIQDLKDLSLSRPFLIPTQRKIRWWNWSCSPNFSCVFFLIRSKPSR